MTSGLLENDCYYFGPDFRNNLTLNGVDITFG